MNINITFGGSRFSNVLYDMVTQLYKYELNMIKK